MTQDRAWWHPEVLAARRPYLEARGRILSSLRDFFAKRDFLEVETPILQVSPGLEPHIMALATRLNEPFAAHRQRLYLHTSPEFAMKKLLAGGMERIYQIARVFRDGERSERHHPEFTMLEWYRAGASYLDLMDDCQALVAMAAKAAQTDRFRWHDIEVDPFAPFERLSVADAFSRYASIDLMAAYDGTMEPDPKALTQEALRIGIVPGASDRWEDIFFRILLDRVEPHLGHAQATILYDYPLCLAALARPKPSDPRLAERFELYVCGVELANAFGELTDARAQAKRFAADRRLKKKLYGVAYPVDSDFLNALRHGLPASAGIALGVDRLVMLATGASQIEDVLWAPVAK